MEILRRHEGGLENMRFLHTADWHLGRIFYGMHLTEDQSFLLDELFEIARDSSPDALLISGDIYDRSIPSPDAVELLNDFISRMILELKIPILLIAGNHDGPSRIQFGSRLFADRGFHVSGTLEDSTTPVVLEDDSGEVCFYSLPYAEPPLVRQYLGDNEIRSHNDAMRKLTDNIRRCHPEGKRSVLLAHAFVAGGMNSESERPLSVGTAGTVDSDNFREFDYVALGHLHAPQRAGSDSIRYSGSLMKYSLSELNQKKSIALVEMDGLGKCTIETVPLHPRRELRSVSGTMEEILKNSIEDTERDDYLAAFLQDRGPLLDPMARLREVYPNVIHLEQNYLNFDGEGGKCDTDHRALDDLELFGRFYEEVTGEDLTEEEIQAYGEVVNSLRTEERNG